MIIIGINDTHDASACIVKDGELLVAISEERPQRIKSVGGFPHKAIKCCLEATGIRPKDIEHVALATKKLVPNNIHNVAATFSVKDHLKWEEEYYYPMIYERRKVKLADVFPEYKYKGDLAYPIETIPFITTSEVTGSEMEDIQEMRLHFTSEFFGIEPHNISFHNHHRCHALYGYYINPNKFKKMLVVTSDAGGDGAYNSVWAVDNGIFTKLVESKNNIVGKIYTSIALLLGMRPNEHEYKVMGLAPYAPEYHKAGPREVFLNSLKIDGMDFIRSSELKDYFFYFRDRLKAYRFDGIAGGLQDFVEIRLSEWFENMVRETGIEDFVYCGGVANNVKANKCILELDCVNSLFVPPGPGDESLSIGAAFCYIYDKIGSQKALDVIRPARHAYWGCTIDADDNEIFKNHEFVKKHYERIDDIDLDDIANLIAKGEVIALCHDKMEFGPRALGHRSLVADPSNTESVRKINDLIKKRDFWMPFTPSIIDKCYDDYVVNSKHIDSSYMTITCDATELGSIHLKAAMHPYDYTVRPQRVYKKTCPIYYELISAFHRLTGIGALLNTSLNIHGKPIVMNPTDLLNEILMVGNIPLKYVLIDNSLYVRKNFASGLL